jgi:hypothetical protein
LLAEISVGSVQSRLGYSCWSEFEYETATLIWIWMLQFINLNASAALPNVKLSGKFIEGNFRVQSNVMYLQWEAESSCSTIFVSARWIWILVGVVICLVKTTIWSDGCSKLSSVAHMVNFYFSDGCCCWPECLRSKLRERERLSELFFSEMKMYLYFIGMKIYLSVIYICLNMLLSFCLRCERMCGNSYVNFSVPTWKQLSAATDCEQFDI